MNVNNVTHCTNNNHQLIMIQGAGGMLIYIVLSYSLNRLLNKQKGKNSIKIGALHYILTAYTIGMDQSKENPGTVLVIE